MQKSEYCEEADKCDLNENFHNFIKENSQNFNKSDERSFEKENKNLINIDGCNRNINRNNINKNNKESAGNSIQKEMDYTFGNKQINLNDKIIDPNTGQSQCSNNKNLSCSIESVNIFSFNKKHSPDCEIQTKINADNDLYFSDNNKNNNNKHNNNNNQARLNEGKI